MDSTFPAQPKTESTGKPATQPKPAAPAQLSPQAKPPAWLKISMASIGGFSSAFVALVAVVLIRPGTQQAGQLVAGDGGNSGLPSTLNIAQDVARGGNPLINAMGSYFFWVLLIILGLVFTSMFFRMARERI